MKKRTIWMIAAACAILLCGCSQSEEPVARTSDFGSAVEDSQGGSDTAGGYSFSESKEGQPESSKPVESAAPSSGKEAPEQPPSASPKEQTSPQSGNTASTAPDSSNQPASAGAEESERQPETTPAPAQPPAAPAEPEPSTAPEPPAPTEPPTPTEPPAPAFDVSSYVGFAQSYGQGIGLSLDSTATACWDDPLTANSGCAYLERDLRDRLDWYAASGFTAFCVWAEDAGGGNYLIYIGYA